jgi:hypothetical protein
MNERKFSWLLAISTGTLLICHHLHAELPPLIPRELLFGSPATSMGTPKISPNGKYLGYVTLDPESRVYNVWLRTPGKHDGRLITQEKKHPIWNYYWQSDSEHTSVGRVNPPPISKNGTNSKNDPFR